MAEREHKRRSAPDRQDEVTENRPAGSESGEKIKAELDELLDEIDEVLETNAEDFVKSYVHQVWRSGSAGSTCRRPACARWHRPARRRRTLG